MLLRMICQEPNPEGFELKKLWLTGLAGHGTDSLQHGAARTMSIADAFQWWASWMVTRNRQLIHRTVHELQGVWGSAWLSNLGSTGSCHRSLPRRELSRRATLIAERIQSGGPRQLGTMETWREATGVEKCWETAKTYFCLLRLWSGVIKQPGFYTFLSVFSKIIASHTLVEHVWLHRRQQTYLEACTLVRRLVTQTNAVQKHPKALSGQEISISSPVFVARPLLVVFQCWQVNFATCFPFTPIQLTPIASSCAMCESSYWILLKFQKCTELSSFWHLRFHGWTTWGSIWVDCWLCLVLLGRNELKSSGWREGHV